MSRLAAIVERKRAEVRELRAARPEQELRASLGLGETRKATAPQAGRLRTALARPRLGAILECKAGSPSAGTLRESYDPVAQATALADVADAISVLCDGPGFGGSYQHLRKVREAVSLPLLAKDIVVDRYQLLQAAEAGADAVLLMLSVLDEASYRDCAAQAAELGLDVLTEVHGAEELARARDLAPPLLGINNRDLHSFEVDLAVCESLAPTVDWPALIVGESGVHCRADVLRLRPHVDALLIGSALSRADDPGREARALLCGRLKVCGLTRESDALDAHQAGATHGGLVLTRSPRQVDRGRAAQLADSAPLAWVAVVSDEPIEPLPALAAELGLAAIQLHRSGDEPARDDADAAWLAEQLPATCELWRVARLRSGSELPAPPRHGDRLLLDAAHAAALGGIGEAFDWAGLETASDRERLILAGGIGPHNAAAADRLGLWALDASSRLESGPGLKDRSRIEAVVAARRGLGRGTAVPSGAAR